MSVKRRAAQLLSVVRPAPTEQRPANHLLAGLPLLDFHRLQPQLTTVPLTFKRVLFRQGEPLSYVWFPNGGVCSIIRQLEDGGAAEVASVGKEGVVGGVRIFGGDEAFGDAIVQVPDGSACVMTRQAFEREMDQGGAFCERVKRFAQALTVMIMQSTVCNSRHVVEARLARWLLMCHDRVGQDTFTMTHEFLAIMLGVRRPTVTTTVAALQDRDLIAYSRQKMTVVNRKGLETLSCECHRVVAAEYSRVLP